MSELERAFEDHVLAPVFRRAAYETLLQTGKAEVSWSMRNQIARESGIDIGEAAALAYLAGHQVEEFMLDAELQTDMLIFGETT
jgi:hypothetical protein